MSVKTATAHWTGTGKDGQGHLTTESGVMSKTPYSFEDEKGTNPEELIAAAHAGCFTMALAFQLQAAGFAATSLETSSAVTLDKDGDGFKVTKSALTLKATIPNIDKSKFDELAKAAETGCPISKVLNAEITLDATLA